MKCNYCNGKGYLKTISVGAVPCSACNGTGEMPITNDEWRKTCSAEEFTETLTKVVLDLVSWNNDPKPSEVRNILKAWLKQQPHTPQKQNDHPCNIKGCSLETRQACCGCPDYFKWKERQEIR